MSEKHIYLSLIPQALIASMLSQREFGTYYAIGTRVHVRGEAMFFEDDPSFRSEDFPFHLVNERCVSHPDGSPKNSVYFSIYEVLKRIPLSALGNLYLTTDDGQTLELQRSEYEAEQEDKRHFLSGVFSHRSHGGQPAGASRVLSNHHGSEPARARTSDRLFSAGFG